ncbi:MAG: AIPR family protein, partial [Alphaproteobacteria bacterium]|nr:AIPR family protein [Alphaproteobacteria bacterium]
MSGLDVYYRNLMADVRREADASGVLMVEAFFDQMSARLAEAGEIETADRAFYESGEGTRRIRIDGYAGDPRDGEGVLGLIVCDFTEGDEPLPFGKADIPPILNPLVRFLKKARTEDFRDALNEVNPAFQISDLIITTWSQITRVKLILISNRRYISRDDSVKLQDLDNVPVTWSVWDLARFERFDRSGQVREDMVIDFSGDFGSPIPALKASQTGAALESYLLIVPGQLLASIYDRWGARLLEANVRTFLQARAKTNKGIQKTIREEPELFFPYNNGLSA